MSSGLLASSIDMGDSGTILVPEHVLLLDFRGASRGARREAKETTRDGRRGKSSIRRTSSTIVSVI